MRWDGRDRDAGGPFEHRSLNQRKAFQFPDIMSSFMSSFMPSVLRSKDRGAPWSSSGRGGFCWRKEKDAPGGSTARARRERRPCTRRDRRSAGSLCQTWAPVLENLKKRLPTSLRCTLTWGGRTAALFAPRECPPADILWGSRDSR